MDRVRRRSKTAPAGGSKPVSVTPDGYGRHMSSERPCPGCGKGRLEPVVGDGVPGSSSPREATRGVELPDCAVADAAPTHRCPDCRTFVWTRGVFGRGGSHQVRLGAHGQDMHGVYTVGGPLLLRDRVTMVVVHPDHVDSVVLAGLLTLFDDGAVLTRWLHDLALSAHGEASGALIRFSLGPDTLVVQSEDGEMTVDDGHDRLVLHLVDDVVRHLGLVGVAGVAEWMEEHACEFILVDVGE